MIDAILRWQRLPLPFIGESDTYYERAPSALESVDLPSSHRFDVERVGDFLLGRICEPVGSNLRGKTATVYRRIFEACGPYELVRTWNMIPDVNELTEGVENYHAFCNGRGDAYAERFGREISPHLPASTGIGSATGCLDITFVATSLPMLDIRHPGRPVPPGFPLPRGDYPPLFSEAVLCKGADVDFGFASGSYPVDGSELVVEGLWKQCAATVRNLEFAEGRLRESGLGQNYARHVNVFIRRREEALFILDYLARNWSRPTDRVRIHRADICLSAVSMEVEFTAVSV